MSRLKIALCCLLVASGCVEPRYPDGQVDRSVPPRPEWPGLAQPNGHAEEPAEQEPAAPKYGLEQRPAWITSRVVGSPEPPPKYRTERVFGDLKFVRPTVLTMAPGSERWFMVEQKGLIYSFLPGENPKQELFIDLTKELIFPPEGDAAAVANAYGLTFHPNFAENRLCYICFTLTARQPGLRLPNGTRVSEFRVSDTDPPRCLPETEREVISWLQGGHNGGCLKFGPDGCLYITAGDGSFPNPPDERLAGQDLTNLLSTVMRIDVDHRTEDQGYTIPTDNPFVDLQDARGEIWAYGFRNPWKISFDRQTGELWLGDVGWEQFEMIHYIERGGNYGWSVQEGSQPVRTGGQRGPTPIRPAAIELPHAQAASITGGYVYRGEKIPALQGAYVFGDWETRRMWGAQFTKGELQSMEELVEPTLRLVAMAEDQAGELYFVDYDDGTIHQLVPNDSPTRPEDFPRRLSETGLFASVPDHQVAPGVLPFSVNAPLWADHAVPDYYVAVPGDGSIVWYDENQPIPGTIMKRQLEFPVNSVLMKTYSLETEAGKPESRRRVETQLLHYNGRTWIGYSYRWNDDQTDAELVDVEGAETAVEITDANAPGGLRRQVWAFHGRGKCVRCHNPWAQHTLAFNIPQLNRQHTYGDVTSNQLATLLHAGLLSRPEPVPEEETTEAVAAADTTATDETADDKPSEAEAAPEADETVELPVEETIDYASLPALTNPYDTTADLDKRARSYLQANCAHCHQFGAGGTADIELRYTFTIEETRTLDARPLQGTFGIANAAIITPGDPYRSLMYFRMAKLGRGRMPHIGSEIIDEPALEMMQAWMRQLPIRTRQLERYAELKKLDEAEALKREKEQRPSRIQRLAKQLADDAKRPISAEDQATAERLEQQHEQNRASEREEQRLTLLNEFLASPDEALFLARRMEEEPLPDSLEKWVLSTVTSRNQPTLQDIFETLIPTADRPQRLGTVVDREALLALKGDPERGRVLFAETEGIQCKNCHRVGDVGKQLGPDLDGIGKKYDRARLLEAILEPSKTIDTRYMTFLAQTNSGKVLVGLMQEQNSEQVVLRDAKGELIRLATEDIELLVPQRQSIMPELLLRDMTAEQVADLLAYLSTLQKATDPAQAAAN